MTRSSQGSSEGLRSLVNFDTASAADRETSRSRSSKRRTMSAIAAGSPVWLMRANVLILCFAGLSQKETGLCSASMSDFVAAPSTLCIQSDCIVIPWNGLCSPVVPTERRLSPQDATVRHAKPDPERFSDTKFLSLCSKYFRYLFPPAGSFYT